MTEEVKTPPTPEPPAEETIKLYDAAEGLTGRGAGIFGDKEERYDLEARQARAEGREPDYDNLPMTPGVKLVPGVTLLEQALSDPYVDRAALLESIQAGELVDPVAEIPVEKPEEEVPEEPAPAEEEVAAEEEAPAEEEPEQPSSVFSQ